MTPRSRSRAVDTEVAPDDRTEIGPRSKIQLVTVVAFGGILVSAAGFGIHLILTTRDIAATMSTQMAVFGDRQTRIQGDVADIRQRMETQTVSRDEVQTMIDKAIINLSRQVVFKDGK